jgi:hypothetical protein
MMKKVLVLYYSQTGQLSSVVESLTKPLISSDEVEVVYQNIEPTVAYPFPWGFLEFFDAFPESVYMDGCAIKEPDNINEDDEFDLVILAYTVWFLSPSIPITGFLNSKYAKILKGKPVITLIACRNMWLMAQEKVKEKLESLGARLIDNVVLVDRGSSLATFITTPRWMLTGKKNPLWGLPEAGVHPTEVKRASRFGLALREALGRDLEQSKEPLLRELEAVQVDEKLIASEKIAHKSFRIWGGLIRKMGESGDVKRVPVLIFYIIFLVTLILTVVPITMLIKPIVRKLNQEKVEKEKLSFEEPSGSGSERLKEYNE